MSIESQGARNVASGDRYTGGFGNLVKTFLYRKATGGKKGSGAGSSGGGSMTAEDWENQDIFNSREMMRGQQDRLHKFQVKEQGKNNAMVRSETTANNDLKRHGARVQSYLQHANDNAGTGRSISRIGSTGGDSFSIDFTNSPAPRSAKPASSPKAPTRQFKGGASGSGATSPK